MVGDCYSNGGGVWNMRRVAEYRRGRALAKFLLGSAPPGRVEVGPVLPESAQRVGAAGAGRTLRPLHFVDIVNEVRTWVVS